MSEEKIFIEKFGEKYYCLRQRKNIQSQSPKKKTADSSNGINTSGNCSRKKETLNNKKIVRPHQLEDEENELYKSVDKLENMVHFKVVCLKLCISLRIIPCLKSGNGLLLYYYKRCPKLNNSSHPLTKKHISKQDYRNL